MSLREEMPKTAAWIDELRSVFGKEGIDAQIRKGMQGIPGAFYACENGLEVGTASNPSPAGKEISAAIMVLNPYNPKNKEPAR